MECVKPEAGMWYGGRDMCVVLPLGCHSWLLRGEPWRSDLMKYLCKTFLDQRKSEVDVENGHVCKYLSCFSQFLDISCHVCDRFLKKIIFSSAQKLFRNAKETDESENKKKEGTLLESEVRKLNYFAALHRPNLFIFWLQISISSVGQSLIVSK